jgi:hypothetical protein
VTRRLHVDGEDFDVIERAGEPGTYELRWVTGPVEGYGFHTARNDRAALDDAALVAAVRSFLGLVDPGTGLLD